MENKIHYTPKALKELDEIWDYIFSLTGSLDTAGRIVERIIAAIDRLETFSHLGTPLSDAIPLERGYRFLVSGSYIIIYHVTKRDVYIDRVLYGRQDYLRLLFPDVSDDENDNQNN